MVRQNRRDLVDANKVIADHALQRTVRKAWLCLADPILGKSCEHRRSRIQNRLQELSS